MWPNMRRDGQRKHTSFCGIGSGATPRTSSARPRCARKPRGPEQRRPRRRSPSAMEGKSASISRHFVEHWRKARGSRSASSQSLGVKLAGRLGPGSLSPTSGKGASALCKTGPLVAGGRSIFPHRDFPHWGHSASSDAHPFKKPRWMALNSFHAEQFWDARFKGPQPESASVWCWRRTTPLGAVTVQISRRLQLFLILIS